MKRLASFTLIVICLATPSFADQVVRATWYGNELRGHRTASGEAFNPAGRTAAHKSLPFGTCLVIGNPKTGRKVAVRVNDRGPFTPGVMLDLASGAAEAIGMRSTQSVTMRLVSSPPSANRSLTAQLFLPSIYFGLGNLSGSDQRRDTCVGQSVAVLTHAIF